MMRLLFFSALALTITSSAAYAQNAVDSAAPLTPKEEVFEVVDVQPEFPGDLIKYLGEEVRYPKSAQRENIQGRVVVRFIVDEQGNVTSAGVVRSAGAVLDAEALRVVRGMPRWKPASVDGRLVKSYFTLPLSFKL